MRFGEIPGVEFLIGAPPHRLRKNFRRADSTEQDETVTISVLMAGAVGEGLLLSDKVTKIEALVKQLDSSRKVIAGDIVIKTTFPYYCVYFDTAPTEDLYVASSCFLIRFSKKTRKPSYHAAFVAAYLNLPVIQETIQGKTTGTSTSTLKKSILEELELPDLEYKLQKQLGEAYFAVCETTRAHLGAIDSLKKTYISLFAENLKIGGEEAVS
jgi:restriction endonuclease S subunit